MQYCITLIDRFSKWPPPFQNNELRPWPKRYIHSGSVSSVWWSRSRRITARSSNQRFSPNWPNPWPRYYLEPHSESQVNFSLCLNTNRRILRGRLTLKATLFRLSSWHHHPSLSQPKEHFLSGIWCYFYAFKWVNSIRKPKPTPKSSRSVSCIGRFPTTSW